MRTIPITEPDNVEFFREYDHRNEQEKERFHKWLADLFFETPLRYVSMVVIAVPAIAVAFAFIVLMLFSMLMDDDFGIQDWKDMLHMAIDDFR